MAVDPSGTRMLALQHSDILLLDMDSAEPRQTFTGPKRRRCQALAFGNNRIFALFKGAREINDTYDLLYSWDANSAELIKQLQVPVSNALAAAPDGNSIALAGNDRMIALYDRTLSLLQSFRAHDAPITALAFHPSESVIASASEDLSVRLWNLQTGARLGTRIGPHYAIRSLSFNATGTRLACSSQDPSVWVWALGKD